MAFFLSAALKELYCFCVTINLYTPFSLIANILFSCSNIVEGACTCGAPFIFGEINDLFTIE